jgi:hypothetical protein
MYAEEQKFQTENIACVALGIVLCEYGRWRTRYGRRQSEMSIYLIFLKYINIGIEGIMALTLITFYLLLIVSFINIVCYLISNYRHCCHYLSDISH